MDFNFDYLPSDIEDEVFLSEVPLELIEKAIQTQFMDPFEYRKKDYVQSFLTKYKFSQDNNFNTDEDRYTIEKYHDDFMGFMIGIFDIYLSLGFPDFDSKPEEDQHELIHMTYRFFIKNIKKNFVNLIMNYTNNNIEDLVEMLSKKKDVTSLNFKLEIENDNDDENIVVHLIMANDGPTSEAGKRYNQSTIKYLKQQITAFSRLKTFPVIDKLKDFFAKC